MAEARPLPAALRRRRNRADHENRFDLAGRQRPGLPQRELRRAGRRLRRRAARADRRRRGPVAGGDYLRHAECQGGAVRDRNRVRTARRAPAADHLGNHHGRLRPHAFWPDHRGVLQLGAPCAAARGRAQLRARREGTAPVRRGTRRGRRGAGLLLPERGCRTRSASTTTRPSRWRGKWATGHAQDSSTWLAVAAAPRPSTSMPSPGRCAG